MSGKAERPGSRGRGNDRVPLVSDGGGLRILYVSHSFPLPDDPLSNVGGMQRVAVALYRTLVARPDVVTIPFLLETSWKWTGLRTGPFLLRLLAGLPGKVRREGIDVVLFSSMVTASVTALIGDSLRKAGALTAAIPVGRDITLPNPIYQRLVPRVLASLDLIFPISKATAETALVRGARPERVHVVPCGVDPPAGAGPISRAAARQEILSLLSEHRLAVGDETLLLLSVGRHQERKGFHWFVDQVLPELPENTLYLLAGSGPMTETITERIRSRRLEKRVALLGQVSEEQLAQLYAGSDLFIMPNIPVPGDIEGFGVVMLEAGAAGLPVVAANLEGISDVIEEGRNGRLVPSGDVGAFLKAIESYREGAPRAAASDAARTHVLERFGWPAVADQMLNILEEAAEKGRKISGRGPAPGGAEGGIARTASSESRTEPS